MRIFRLIHYQRLKASFSYTVQKIKIINKEIDSDLKANKKISTQINDTEKLPNTADIKCTIYKIN